MLRANEILKVASALGGARTPIQILRELIDEHHDKFGVEPICKALQISRQGIDGMQRFGASRNGARRGSERRRSCAEKRASLSDQHGGLQGRESLTATASRRHGGGAVHDRSIDEAPRTARRHARKSSTNDGQRPQGAVPTGQGQTGSSRPSGRTSAGSRTSRTSRPGKAGSTWLRHRLLRQVNRGLARQPFDGDRLRSRCSGAGSARSAARARSQPRGLLRSRLTTRAIPLRRAVSRGRRRAIGR